MSANNANHDDRGYVVEWPKTCRLLAMCIEAGANVGKARFDEFGFRHGRPVKHSCDRPAAEHEHAIAMHQFTVLGAVPDHQPALLGGLGENTIDFLFDADVHPTCGIVEKQDRVVGTQGTDHQRLLLIATAPAEDRVVGSFAWQTKPVEPGKRPLPQALGGDDGPRAGCRDGAKGCVLEDRIDRKDTIAAPVPGHEGGLVPVKQAVAQCRHLSLTLKTGKPHDLAFPKRDRLACPVDGIVGREAVEHIAGASNPRNTFMFQPVACAPAHLGEDRGDIRFAGVSAPHDVAVLHDRHGRDQRQDLFDLVADVDRGHAPCGDPLQKGSELPGPVAVE